MYSKFLSLILFLGIIQISLTAQDSEAKVKPRPIRSTFESTWLLDNQTVDVPFQGTFQWDILHRFGTWDNGYDDYYGLAAPSNIRLGFFYVPVENLSVGFGITKERKMWDFNAKYVFIKQKRDDSFPFSLTYFGSAGIDSRDLDRFEEASDRFSYFNQLMIARKFSDGFSLQIAPSLSYFNNPDFLLTDGGVSLDRFNNMHFAISAMARIKVTEQLGFLVNTDFPLTNHSDLEINQPKNNISLGIELTTSSHAFQIFVGNYQSINPQLNHVFNQNKFGDNQILLGFNMTRLWNF